MLAEETLSTISQLGIAFAAFVAIFFAFSRGLGEFSHAQKLRIRTILSTCLWVMFVGLFPLTSVQFLAIEFVFRVSALIALVTFLVIGIDSFRYVQKMTAIQRAQVQDLNFYASWVLATITIVSLIIAVIDIFPKYGEGVYLLAALGGLALCTTNFLTLAFERLFKSDVDHDY